MVISAEFITQDLELSQTVQQLGKHNHELSVMTTDLQYTNTLLTTVTIYGWNNQLGRMLSKDKLQFLTSRLNKTSIQPEDSNPDGVATQIALESIGELASRIWEGIKTLLRKIYDMVMAVISSIRQIFGQYQKLVDQMTNRLRNLKIDTDKLTESPIKTIPYDTWYALASACHNGSVYLDKHLEIFNQAHKDGDTGRIYPTAMAEDHHLNHLVKIELKPLLNSLGIDYRETKDSIEIGYKLTDTFNYTVAALPDLSWSLELLLNSPINQVIAAVNKDLIHGLEKTKSECSALLRKQQGASQTLRDELVQINILIRIGQRLTTVARTVIKEWLHIGQTYYKARVE